MAKKTVSVAYEDPRFSKKEAKYFSEVRRALDEMGAPNSGELLHNSKTYVEGVYKAGLPALEAAAVLWHQHCDKQGSQTTPCVAEDVMPIANKTAVVDPWTLAGPGQWQLKTSDYPSGGYMIRQIPGGFELFRWDTRIGKGGILFIAAYPSLPSAKHAARVYASQPGGSEAAECPCETEEAPVISEANDSAPSCVPFTRLERNNEAFAACKAIAKGPIDTDRAMYDLLSSQLGREDQEVFVVVGLDLHNNLRSYTEVARGQRDRVAVNVEDVLRAAILDGPHGFIVSHNHPSGKANPSPADRDLTRRIKEGASAACPSVVFLDHLVIGQGEYFSFADNKLKKVRG